ncbi:CbiQ family ECF transporter T component [Cellulomonas sp. HZM]|uniref:CbiQ family ECF transporter T component n=1 Tax=Cellulomonas sp. HZM TaxID=1454010 RepID=UPI000493A05C|nr:CbiQ family ECF transporter T component [Cellulomonas sp. HZM]
MSGPQRPPWSGPLGLFHPGTSPVHRCPAPLKLLALAALGLALALLHGPVSALVGLALVLVVHVVARVPWRRTLRGARGVLVVALLVGLYQWWASTWQAAVEVSVDLLALVLAATLVTTTTRADALLDVLARAAGPLRHVGLRPETFALACGLVLRTIPVLVRSSLETRDAARARGLERDPRAVLVPAAVRMVAHARATGDALAARGLGE